MAEIFSSPKGVEIPKFDWSDIKKYNEDIVQYKAELKAMLIEHVSKGKLVGEVIKFPVADGHAEYMVASMSPLKLVHLPIGDAWDFQYVNLLTSKEVKEKIEAEKKLAEFFAKNK